VKRKRVGGLVKTVIEEDNVNAEKKAGRKARKKAAKLTILTKSEDCKMK
jgi:hypothetical protein